MDHIIPNFILIIANLERYQTSMSHGDDMIIRPCDLVGLQKLLSWPMKFFNDLLFNKIYCATIVNNQLSGLVFGTYPHVKFLSMSPFLFFLFICSEELMNDKCEIILSCKNYLHNMSSWSLLRLSIFSTTLLHARPSKHMLNMEGL